MQPDKILFVDDEPMAVKYFERLVSSFAPVLSANSVAQAKEILRSRSDEIAVLVSDQRMPVAQGNELLAFARENYPGIVRMLTTAYSELGDAIQAVNSGEIFRYLPKPWDLESLRADLKNALELAHLRHQRELLLREKLLLSERQLIASRIGALAVACAASVDGNYERGLNEYLAAAVRAGLRPPEVPWQRLDHSELMQLEAQRAIGACRLLRQQAAQPAGEQPLDELVAMLPGTASRTGDAVHISDRAPLTQLLEGSPEAAVTAAHTAWLAWLLRFGKPVRVNAAAQGWEVRVDTAAPALQAGWLAAAMDAATSQPPA
jgi:two-component system probable response regulator PhcQ